MSHTPGPWKLTDTDGHFVDGWNETVGANDFTIATVYNERDVWTSAATANANLIAAAPELLDALLEMEALIPIRAPHTLKVPHSTIAKIKNAIKKAEGR